jgi:hypothetical protein
VPVDALGHVVRDHVGVALGGLDVAMAELLLDEVQRLAVDEPVGRCGVAQIVQSDGAPQASALEGLLVPLLADDVAR